MNLPVFSTSLHSFFSNQFDRLGEPEKGLYHFKQAGPEADPDAMAMATKVQNHLNKCTDAKRQRDWNALLKEIALSTSAGADSAPLVATLMLKTFVFYRYIQSH